MRKLILPCLIAFAMLLSGCYASQVTTENEPGGETITETRAGYLFGLSMQGMPIDGASKCPNGVASVSTELTFLDMLIASTPIGLFYSPMHITIECAAGGSMSGIMPAPEIDFEVPEHAEQIEVEETITSAAEKSAITDRPVQVKFAD